MKIFKAALVACLLFILWGGSMAFSAEEEKRLSDEEAILAFRSDQIPENAFRAVRQYVRWHYAYSPLPSGIVERLRGLIQDTDYQMRQIAAYLLVCDHMARLNENRMLALEDLPQGMIKVMIEGLGSDSMDNFSSVPNAKAFSSLMFKQAKKVPAEWISALEAALDDQDHQRAQYATKILSDIYVIQNVTAQRWPEAYIRELVKGLKDDDIHYPYTFDNRNYFFSTLYDLKERQPKRDLEELLSNSQDIQAQFAAAILLGHYAGTSVQPAITRVLRRHLRNDRCIGNGIFSYRALYLLGKENLEASLKEEIPTDSQEAAYLQILSALMEISWTAPEEFLPEWYQVSLHPQSLAVPYYGKVETAALYLYPGVADFLKDKEIPKSLGRLQNLSANLKTPLEKAQWLGTYYTLFSASWQEGDRSYAGSVAYSPFLGHGQGCP